MLLGLGLIKRRLLTSRFPQIAPSRVSIPRFIQLGSVVLVTKRKPYEEIRSQRVNDSSSLIVQVNKQDDLKIFFRTGGKAERRRIQGQSLGSEGMMGAFDTTTRGSCLIFLRGFERQ